MSDESRDKAVKRRLNEYRNTKRDIVSKLTQNLAVIPDDLENCKIQFDLLTDVSEKYSELLNSVELLNEDDWSEANCTSELGAAMRVLENARLEIISSSRRIEKRLKGSEKESPVQQSFLADLPSLSFGQLFRLGLFFSLPLIISVVVSAIIISIAYAVTVLG